MRWSYVRFATAAIGAGVFFTFLFKNEEIAKPIYDYAAKTKISSSQIVFSSQDDISKFLLLFLLYILS